MIIEVLLFARCLPGTLGGIYISKLGIASPTLQARSLDHWTQDKQLAKVNSTDAATPKPAKSEVCLLLP